MYYLIIEYFIDMNAIKRNTKNILLCFIIIICIFLIIYKPDTYISSSLTGIKLWALLVLPSLLPFFFLTALMTKTGITDKLAHLAYKPAKFLFGCSGICGYAFIMSILSGYPVGAKIISDLKNNGLIDENEATKMSTFCSTSGPLFIIGSVGIGMYGDKKVGYILLLSHILSAIISGIIFRGYKKGKISENRRFISKNDGNILYECVYSSVITVALVGGFICIFYILADMAINLKITLPLDSVLNLIIKDKSITSGFTSGLIECTRGAKALSECGITAKSIFLTSSLISFGGVSVIAQSIMFLKTAKVKTGIFILSKLLQMIISFILSFCLFYLIY